MSDQLLHGDLTDTILGAFYAVHTQLGHGFLESVYANAMAALLRRAGLRVEREVAYEIYFHGERIGFYRADLVIESKVIVETKTARAIADAHVAQLYNCLRVSQVQVGLVANFGEKATFKRAVSTRVCGSAVSSSRVSPPKP